MARARRDYNPVAASETNNAEVPEDSERPASTRSISRRLRQYSRVSSSGGGAEDEEESILDGEVTELTSVSSDSDDGRRITVVVLDFAQKKFRVEVNPSWTVARFREEGALVHKVPPDRQRLIYRGKLLEDKVTLEESGITEDETIVHLFPKPRVVITASNNNTNESTSSAPATSNAGEDVEAGARIPTIVIDAEEAERRSQILVLGSADYAESQGHVKLFSFMLLIISSIELLNLLTIALGVPQTDADGDAFPLTPEDDDIFPKTDDAQSDSDPNYAAEEAAAQILATWGWLNYIDLAISVLGVYVALTGLKASNVHRLSLARRYLWGTVIVGIGWMLFNFFVSVEIDEAVEEERKKEYQNDDYQGQSESEIYSQAFQVMIIPGMVWFLCCLRAWQFQSILQEAEDDARARSHADIAAANEGNELSLQSEGASLA